MPSQKHEELRNLGIFLGLLAGYPLSNIRLEYRYEDNEHGLFIFDIVCLKNERDIINNKFEDEIGLIIECGTLSKTGEHLKYLRNKFNLIHLSYDHCSSIIESIIKTEDLAIRKISVSVVNAVNNIKIMITKLAGMPATISHEISGKVYHYIKIEGENITDADINKTFIRFAVNKTWLTDNNINYSNISFYRWENVNWNELPTSYVGEDVFELFYEAESSGFSTFVIGTTGGVPEILEEVCTENWSCTDWSACVNGTQTRTCTDANACGTTVNKPVESQSCEIIEAEVAEVVGIPIWSIAVVVMVIVIVVVLIILKIKGKISFAFLRRNSKPNYYNFSQH